MLTHELWRFPLWGYRDNPFHVIFHPFHRRWLGVVLQGLHRHRVVLQRFPHLGAECAWLHDGRQWKGAKKGETQDRCTWKVYRHWIGVYIYIYDIYTKYIRIHVIICDIL